MRPQHQVSEAGVQHAALVGEVEEDGEEDGVLVALISEVLAQLVSHRLHVLCVARRVLLQGGQHGGRVCVHPQQPQQPEFRRRVLFAHPLHVQLVQVLAQAVQGPPDVVVAVTHHCAEITDNARLDKDGHAQ